MGGLVPAEQANPSTARFGGLRGFCVTRRTSSAPRVVRVLWTTLTLTLTLTHPRTDSRSLTSGSSTTVVTTGKSRAHLSIADLCDELDISRSTV